jgi:hypothetical protein
MSGNVFVADQVLVDVSFDAARRQLRRLAGDGVLLGASEYGYRAGITGLAQEPGLAAALGRLAGVELGDLMETRRGARLPLRWQATEPDGALFSALDADLTLSPAGEETTVFALAGVYRLPDQAGAGLDPAIVRCFANVTIRSFMARLACALTHPAGTAVPAGRARPEDSCREPGSMPSRCRSHPTPAARQRKLPGASAWPPLPW